MYRYCLRHGLPLELATMIKLTIQRKLLLASTTLLIIPWIGYQYIQEMQGYLHQNMESELLSKVKLVAASLHERPTLFKSRFNTSNNTNQTSITPLKETQHLYVRPISSRIKLDGISDDWTNIKTNISSYGANNDLLENPTTDLSFKMQLGSKKHFLYVLFQVKDDHLVFRKANSLSIDQSDHLVIAMQNRKGEYVRYILTSKRSGWVSAYRINSDTSNTPEIQIKGSWQQTAAGYNIEIRIPTYIIGEKLAFAIADIDDKNTRNTKSIIATTNIDSLEVLGTIVVPSPQVEKLLSQIKQQNTRIWVIDKSFHVIGLSDQLLEEPTINALPDASKENQQRSILTGLMHLIYQQFLKQPSNRFIDELSTVSQLNTPEVLSALNGKASTAWRSSPDNQVSILTATHPIYSNGQVVGAVAIEETSNNILLLQNQAMEILINLSILTFLIAFIVLLSIAIRLSSRIRKLRDEAEHAISTDGKVAGKISTSTSQDEIGDLSRSSANMLERLSQYNRYLEGMASKLAHELRTPITVVRSSIENMEQNDTKDKEIYLERASIGINRLNNILTRMSEASRLEQTLQTEELEIFDIASVIKGCVEGYQQVHPNQSYLLQINSNNDMKIKGSPDLIAQMLDKLVSNANDYSSNNTDINIQLQNESNNVILKVMNQGESLHHEMINNLFDSMVSLRTQKTDEPHLGLGLHIVRLIAEFHHGSVKAYNTNNKMVCFEVILPIEN